MLKSNVFRFLLWMLVLFLSGLTLAYLPVADIAQHILALIGAQLLVWLMVNLVNRSLPLPYAKSLPVSYEPLSCAFRG